MYPFFCKPFIVHNSPNITSSCSLRTLYFFTGKRKKYVMYRYRTQLHYWNLDPEIDPELRINTMLRDRQDANETF
jgi:hypothetical protein